MSKLIRVCRAGALASFLIGATACRGPAAPEVPDLSSKKLGEIRQMLEDHVEKKQLAGAVALVARRDRLVYLDSVGHADVETRKPMTPYTIFRICSMTKPITSIAVLQLIEEGKMGLGDPLYVFLPEFRNARVLARRAEGGKKDEEAVAVRRGITIRDLLTHTSGLTYTLLGHEPLADLYRRAGVTDGLAETDMTIAENAAKLSSLPLGFDPGTAWEYSLATDVLGRVIEVVSGERLDRYLERRIFEPLGMKDTHFRLPPEKRDRLATVYQPTPDKVIERLPDGTIRNGYAVYSASYPYSGPGTYLSGGAGLVSTALDYARFLEMLLNGGERDGVRILKKENVHLMTSDQCAGLDLGIKSHGDGFGFGFGVVTEAGADLGLGSAGTFSWGGFYYTYFWVDPKLELIGIFMAQLHPWGDLAVWDQFRKLVYGAIVEKDYGSGP
jgi:CubicO group peptidase (beta-lactamase class C family)